MMGSSVVNTLNSNEMLQTFFFQEVTDQALPQSCGDVLLLHSLLLPTLDLTEWACSRFLLWFHWSLGWCHLMQHLTYGTAFPEDPNGPNPASLSQDVEDLSVSPGQEIR